MAVSKTINRKKKSLLEKSAVRDSKVKIKSKKIAEKEFKPGEIELYRVESNVPVPVRGERDPIFKNKMREILKKM
jgi:hypothetical protein